MPEFQRPRGTILCTNRTVHEIDQGKLRFLRERVRLTEKEERERKPLTGTEEEMVTTPEDIGYLNRMDCAAIV